MSIAHAMLAEFDQECRATRLCLERVPADKLGWQPHAKSMTLGQLATHLATIPKFMLGMGLQDQFDFADLPPKFAGAESVEEMLAMFDESSQFMHEHLANMDDARLFGEWRALRGGVQMIALPRAAMLRSFLLNHWIHHRGQLSVYLRLLDIPVPSIYGPSADENPFA